MATLYITEYAAADINTGFVREPEVTTQTVAIAGSSAQSSALASQTSYIRLHTDAICSVLIGTNPTATAAKKRMAAGQTEIYAVVPNTSLKVAVITNS